MRIADKIDETERYLAELLLIMPDNFRDYVNDLKTKAACERYFEKIIEATVDLAFLVIKDNSFRVPEDDKEAFDILAGEKMIDAELSARLKDAKGMRNILAHQYGQVDDEIVFEAITKELARDVNEFLGIMKKRI